MSDFSAKLIEIADFDYGDPASGDRLLHTNWLRGAAEHIKGLESQAAEIESLRARLEEEHKDAMKWSGIAGAYTNKCNALTEKVERYEKWFRENAAVLASHRIGGYFFVDGIVDSSKAVPIICEDCGQPIVDRQWCGCPDIGRPEVCPEPSKAQPSEN